MRLEKLDLIEWGWHKTGDPTKPVYGNAFWANPEWPQFYVVYDEFEGNAAVLYRYAKGGSDFYEHIESIYRFMNIHKDYKHEWEDED